MPVCNTCFSYYIREPCPHCANSANSTRVISNLKSEAISQHNLPLSVKNMDEHTKSELVEFITETDRVSNLKIDKDKLISLNEKSIFLLDKAQHTIRNLTTSLKAKKEALESINKNNIQLRTKVNQQRHWLTEKKRRIKALEEENEQLRRELEKITATNTFTVPTHPDDKISIINIETIKQLLQQLKTKLNDIPNEYRRSIWHQLDNISLLLGNKDNKDSNISNKNVKLRKYPKVLCKKCQFRLSPNDIEVGRDYCSACLNE